MHLIMENKNLVWLLERKQIIFGNQSVIQKDMILRFSFVKWKNLKLLLSPLKSYIISMKLLISS